MIEKLRFEVVPSSSSGILHDSRGDVKTLSKAVNTLIGKINELVEENNRLSKEVDGLKSANYRNKKYE